MLLALLFFNFLFSYFKRFNFQICRVNYLDTIKITFLIIKTNRLLVDYLLQFMLSCFADQTNVGTLFSGCSARQGGDYGRHSFCGK